jgi:O-acetyl-ADP-ribose deacetylase (regulator of RNase III)
VACTVVVVQGDLTAARTDVIVNAANEHLVHGGGVAAALAAVGGEEFIRDSKRWVAEHGPVPPGQAAITTGGGLPARWVVHVVGPRYREGQDNATLLREAVRAALDAAAELGATTVAMPAISTGVFGYPLEPAAEEIVAESLRWAYAYPATLSQIRLVAYDDRTADALQLALERRE